MAYHITLITNNSSSSISMTNPANEGDSRLIGPNSTYAPSRPVLINKMSGNPTYEQALPVANNIYTLVDNFCFWDNTNSAVNGTGEKGSTINFNHSAADLQITVDSKGYLNFAVASASAAASQSAR